MKKTISRKNFFIQILLTPLLAKFSFLKIKKNQKSGFYLKMILNNLENITVPDITIIEVDAIGLTLPLELEKKGIRTLIFLIFC